MPSVILPHLLLAASLAANSNVITVFKNVAMFYSEIEKIVLNSSIF